MTTNPAPAVASRALAGARDIARAYELADVARDEAPHVVDLPWRMTSPSAHVPDRTHLWEDVNGDVIAWAILQLPAWHCVDYVVRPDARTAGLESAVLDWACARLEIEATGSLPFLVSARADDHARIAAIERAGFVRETWGYVHLVRDLGQPIPKPTLPQGFEIRPLAGTGEVDAYVAAHRAAFGSTNMDAEWRLRTLHDPRYEPDLDLVAVTPDGTLAGFCVCWITPSSGRRREAQVEPLGVLPAFQRIGLGRALLLEGLRRVRALGAVRMRVNAERSNAASQAVYRAVAFRPAYEVPFFQRRFG